MQRLYSDQQHKGYTNHGWVFSSDDGDTFIEEYNKNDNSIWRIAVIHEISEDDYKKERQYSIPINHFIFFPL